MPVIDLALLYVDFTRFHRFDMASLRAPRPSLPHQRRLEAIVLSDIFFIGGGLLVFAIAGLAVVAADRL